MSQRAVCVPSVSSEGYAWRFSQAEQGVNILESAFFTAQPQEQVFAYFSQAENLENMTPPQLSFKILTPLPIEMGVGTLIDYAIRLQGVPMRWRTLIPVWEPPHRFVDLQLKGPYQLWEHEHRFKPLPEGTLIIDRIRYKVPGGELAHRFFVKPQLKAIFAYRYQIMQQQFGNSD